MPDWTPEEQAMMKDMAKIAAHAMMDIPRSRSVPYSRGVLMGLHALEIALSSHLLAMEDGHDARMALVGESLIAIAAYTTAVAEREKGAKADG